MKLLFALIFIALLPSAESAARKHQTTAHQETNVRSGVVTFAIDLRKAENDRTTIVVTPPQTLQTPASDSIVYIMPAIAPGTYSRYDFGRFIHEFRPFSGDGKELAFHRRSVNEFVIPLNSGLSKIEYSINDSFDDDGKPSIFHPCGTNIQPDTNFMFNFPGVCGYFGGYKHAEIRLEIHKQPYLYGATSLEAVKRTDELDVFTAKNYDELADNPAMYSRADTTSYSEGNCTITIATFSMNGKVKSGDIAGQLRPLTGAVHRFLGEMPVKRYTFIFFFADLRRSDVVKNALGSGALEHSYSSVYFLHEPDRPAELRGLVQHVAAHEFLHILVPLHLHSREIDDFDFLNPKMSEHLWLYEGVTEYFAQLSLVRGGLISHDDFRGRVRQKLMTAAFMAPKPFSLTEFSRSVLSAENQKLYPIIYEKGAVSGLLLDVIIQESSNGKQSLLDVVQRLSRTYGPAKPFNDSDLFSAIGEISPAAEEYLRSHVADNAPLPVVETLAKIGWKYIEAEVQTIYSFGTIKVKPTADSTGLAVTFSFSDNRLKLLDNDVITAVNATAVTPATAQKAEELLLRPPTSGTLMVEVRRGNETLTLSGTPKASEQKRQHVLVEIPEQTAAQTTLRQRLLGGDAGR